MELKVTYSNGESAIYMAGLPEWSKWERKTGKSVYSITPERMKEVGLGGVLQQSDFLFLAHAAYVRQAAGKPTKPYDIWEVGVEEIEVGNSEDPKSTHPEALSESATN